MIWSIVSAFLSGGISAFDFTANRMCRQCICAFLSYSVMLLFNREFSVLSCNSGGGAEQVKESPACRRWLFPSFLSDLIARFSRPGDRGPRNGPDEKFSASVRERI
jgi:hypothetical protein